MVPLKRHKCDPYATTALRDQKGKPADTGVEHSLNNCLIIAYNTDGHE
jgi:hypothetical protein